MKLISKVIKKVEKENKGIKSSNDILPTPTNRKRTLHFILFIGIILLLGGGGYFFWNNILHDTSPPLPKSRGNLSERLEKAKKKTVVSSSDNVTVPDTDSTHISLAGGKTDSTVHPSSTNKKKVQIEKRKEPKKEELSTQPSLAKTTAMVDSTDLLQPQKNEVPIKNSEFSSFKEIENDVKEKSSLDTQFTKKIDTSHKEESPQVESPILNTKKKLPDIKYPEKDKPVIASPLPKKSFKGIGLLSLQEKKQLADNYFGFGLKSQKTGKLKEAQECYIKALELDPGFYQARLNLSTLYLTNGKLVDAEKELSRLLTQNHDESKVIYNYTLLCYRKKEFKKAEEFIEKLLIQDSKSSNAYLLKGRILEEQSKFEEAISAYTQAYQLNSDDPRIIYSLGRVKDIMGNKEEALAYYHRFLKNSSEENSNLKRSVWERVSYLKSGGELD